MEIRFCRCGVPVSHFRIFIGAHHSRPFCSQKAVIIHLSAKLFFFLDRRDEPTLCQPDDGEECFQIVAERLHKLPQEKRELYLAVLKELAIPEIPATDQEAWDALPEVVKAPVRALPTFRPGAISPRDTPGTFGTLWDWPSVEGSNVPDVEPCNIYTMLYNKARGTLLR